ncbi:helix-turn-helix domain-containing protein [Methylobacterium trifolii]|uniref:Antitoxin HigA n=1 Tax=Methylobacterium trifolii TaxID=1003092 RepID=A0ABQ4U5R1_9HYPH|nr:transcriptional regulator [Methylobacterium trifolii]GJE61470.1 Antitoxin HigA [Methylobacterium trifolii]
MPPRNSPFPAWAERDYDAAVDAMNALIDAGAGNEDHPLACLLAILGDRIGAYDARHHALPDAAPAQVLAWLMGRHGLRQGDLPEIGSQGVVSEVLSGKRALNAGQVRRLSDRFGVGPSAFL